MIFFIYFCQIRTREVLIVSLSLFARLLICTHFCSYVLMSQFLLVWLLLTVCFHPWAFQRKRICLTAPLRSAMSLFVYEYRLNFSKFWWQNLIFFNFLWRILVYGVVIVSLSLFSRLLICAHLCSFLLMCRFLSAWLPLTVCFHLWGFRRERIGRTAPLRSAPLRLYHQISKNFRLEGTGITELLFV